MRNVRLWRALLGVDKRTVVEDIEFSDGGEDAEVVVARVPPPQRCFTALWALRKQGALV